MEDYTENKLVFKENYLMVIAFAVFIPFISALLIFFITVNIAISIIITFILFLVWVIYNYLNIRVIYLNENQLTIKSKRNTTNIDLKNIQSMKTSFNWLTSTFRYEIATSNKIYSLPVMENEKTFQNAMEKFADLKLVKESYNPLIAVNFKSKTWGKKI